METLCRLSYRGVTRARDAGSTGANGTRRRAGRAKPFGAPGVGLHRGRYRTGEGIGSPPPLVLADAGWPGRDVEMLTRVIATHTAAP